MKKFFKILFSIIGIIFLCLLIIAEVMKNIARPTRDHLGQKSYYTTQVPNKSEFARMVERADKECPIPLAVGRGATTGIKLENGYLTYYVSINHDFANDLKRQYNDEKFKESTLLGILCMNAQGDKEGSYMMDLLIKNNYGLRVIFSEVGDRLYESSISVNEIETFREKYMLNPHEALYNLLTMSIELERESLPTLIDEGMIMTDYKLEGDNIVYIIQADENLYSISEMYENRSIVKESIIEGIINDPECMSILYLCKISHTGLTYRIYGSHTHERADIVITSNEIRRLVQAPAGVDIQ